MLYVTFVGNWNDRPAGTWKVTLPIAIADTANDIRVPSGVYASGLLNVEANGEQLDVDVPCSDDPNVSPTGWQATLTVTFNDGRPTETYPLDTNVNLAGTTVDLSDYVLPGVVDDPTYLLARGVAGGLAELDADGDVIDAAGTKVVGGGGGGITTEDALDAVGTALTQGNNIAITVDDPNDTITIAVTGLTKSDVGLGNVDNTADTAKPISTATQSALDAKASLVGGKVPSGELPAIATNETVTVANDAARFALTTTSVQNGDVVIQTDSGLRYLVTDDTDLGTEGGYTPMPSGGAVDSVNGYTGIVVLAKGDVGLGSVDNTADTAKPVSTAQQTALDGKSDTGHAHVSTDVSDFSEAVDDRVNALVVDGTGLTKTYDDVANTLTLDVDAHNHDATYAPIAHASDTNNPHSVTKAQVGLTNVDNTADTAKPVSTAQQTALDLKADEDQTVTFIAETSTGVWTRDAPNRPSGLPPIAFYGEDDPADVTNGVDTPANISPFDTWVQLP